MTADTAPLRNEESLVRLFIGRNAEKFMGLYRSQVMGKHQTSLNWAALFFPTTWFLYRKMWLWGAGIIILPIVFLTLFPDLARFGNSGLAIACGVSANTLYVQTARNRIAAIERRDLAEAERDMLIAKAGGTSVGGLIFGILLTAALFSLALASMAPAKQLPDCTDASYRALAEGALRQGLARDKVPAEGLSTGEFTQTEATTDKRGCLFTATLQGQSVRLRSEATWEDKAAGQYRVTLMGRVP
jgi:hypothetical protein